LCDAEQRLNRTAAAIRRINFIDRWHFTSALLLHRRAERVTIILEKY